MVRLHIIEQMLYRLDTTEQIMFRIRFEGTYQQNSIKFPVPYIHYSLRPRSVWFEYHPQYRVVWDDTSQKAIIMDRLTETELPNGTNIDFVVRGRMVCSDL